MSAHFKPFTRAESGAPSHRRCSSRKSWSDGSKSYQPRYRRRRHGNTIIIINVG